MVIVGDSLKVRNIHSSLSVKSIAYFLSLTLKQQKVYCLMVMFMDKMS